MRYAFIFPGQGSQASGMGKNLYENFNIAKEMFEQANEILKVDMKKLCFEENDLINQTEFTQPAIFLCSAIAHQIFQQEFPLLPTIALGHSLGEITANYIANGIDFANGILLARKRGEMMKKTCSNIQPGMQVGMMVVIGAEEKKLEEYCKEVTKKGKVIFCANYNTPEQTVLAGSKSDLIDSQADLKTMGAKKTLMLPMPVISHCPLLEPMVEDFKSLLNEVLNERFSLRVVSNVNASTYSSKSEALELLSSQLVWPVLYKQSIMNIDYEVDAYLEFGHGNVLQGLNKRLSKKPTYSIQDTLTLNETLSHINA